MMKRFFRRGLLLAISILGLWGIMITGVQTAAVAVSGEAQPTQAILVLGTRVLPTGRPGSMLTQRLQAALEAWREHPQLIVCCGGQGSDEPAAEGKVMRDWLIMHGVPSYMVKAENASTNTYENITLGQQLLPPGVKDVTIVTSDYHLPRALAIAGDNGLEAVGVSSPTRVNGRLQTHSREVLAWGKYLLKKFTGTVV